MNPWAALLSEHLDSRVKLTAGPLANLCEARLIAPHCYDAPFQNSEARSHYGP